MPQKPENDPDYEFAQSMGIRSAKFMRFLGLRMLIEIGLGRQLKPEEQAQLYNKCSYTRVRKAWEQILDK